ncbi:MAG: CBS domain-containing protein [Clostridiales bacterium]|nr:CBS domain-containing protein [Clostridiales bacterium]
MRVSDKMTRNVACVQTTATLTEAAQMMQKHNVGSVPVCDAASTVVGMLTDRDIVVRTIAWGRNPQTTPVTDVMTGGVATVTPEMDMEDVARIMSDKQIRRVPVVDKGKLVGILALGDIATDYRYNIEASEALSDISRPSRPVR